MNKNTSPDHKFHASTLWKQGLSLFHDGDFLRAYEVFSRIAHNDSRNPEAWMMIGVIQGKLSNLSDAAYSYRKSLALKPDNAEAHANLANTLLKQGDVKQAIHFFSQALQIKPELWRTRLQLGQLLIANSLFREAESILSLFNIGTATEPQAFMLLAETKHRLGKSDEAEQLLYSLIKKFPEHGSIHNNLAIILLDKGCCDEALQHVDKALTTQPQQLEYRLIRLRALSCLRHFDDADLEFNYLSEVEPSKIATLFSGRAGVLRYPDETPAAKSTRVLFVFQWLSRLATCDWKEYDVNLKVCLELNEHEWRSLPAGTLPSLQPFSSLLLPFSPSFQLELARNYSNRILENISPLRNRMAYPKTQDRRSIIKIGYVSPDFRNHPTAHLARAMFAIHDRNEVEVFGYSLCNDDGSPEHAEIKKGCDHFTYLNSLSNLDAANRIAQDEVDILVDLAGYTASARPEIFALRPAPIQVNYLGFPGSTGAPWIDYTILGADTIGTEGVKYFSEKIVWLPECHYVVSPFPKTYDNPASRSDQGLPDEGFIFCSFQGSKKIDPQTFSSWMHILDRVPGSYLWLLGGTETTVNNLRTQARARAIDTARLLFAPLTSVPDHITRLPLADLFLDTLVYSGITTIAMTLWAGVPVITCSGTNTMAARQGTEALVSIGLQDLVARDRLEYEERAIFLAHHPETLTEIRSQLSKHRFSSPLFNTQRTVRYLEKAYHLMWQRHQSNLSPTEIVVPSLP